MLASLIAVFALTAPPPPPPPATHIAVQEEQATPVDPIQAVIDEYDAAYKEFMKLYRAADKDARNKVVAEHLPSSDEYAERVLALTEQTPGTEPALNGLLWVLQNGGGDVIPKATAAIEKNHMDSERLGPLCSSLSRDTENGEQLLLVLVEKSPHDTVRGAACFNLGRLFMNKAGSAEYGGASAEETAASRQTALEFFERVEDEFADIENGRRGTLGEAAERNLFQLNNLQIGMLAPDIEAADLDGVSFKLSDYRGKVVVLDFWGDW